MVLVNNATIKIIAKQSNKKGKTLLNEAKKAANVGKIRSTTTPLTNDVVENSQRGSNQAQTAINPAMLQELANKDLSLNEIASELGVSIGTARLALQKHNIITVAQRKFRILREYFSATTKERKAKAFAEIDKYLKQIAKKEAGLQKDVSYEDCLQDVRLRFLELAEQSQRDGVSFSTTILKKLQETKPSIKKEIATLRLDESKLLETDIQVNDFGLKMVENKDYIDQLLTSTNVFTEREKRFIESIIEGGTIADLEMIYGLSKERVTQIIKKAIIPKLKLQYYKVTSNEYLEQRAMAIKNYIDNLSKNNKL